MPIRLVAIDLDHTLLTSERVPHPASAAAIRRAREAGVIVVLASGRILPGIRPFAKMLGIEDAPFICGNGSLVLGPNETEIAHWGVSNEVFDIVYEYSNIHRVHMNVYTREDLFFLSDSRWGEEYVGRVRNISPRLATPEELRKMQLSKVMLVDEPSQIPVHQAAVGAQIRDIDVRMTLSEPEYLEFLSPKATKGAALSTIASVLNIRQEETAAIGDYLNDLEMLRWVAVGGAVANALEEVKREADVVVASNEDGGVGEFIDSVVLNRRE